MPLTVFGSSSCPPWKKCCAGTCRLGPILLSQHELRDALHTQMAKYWGILFYSILTHLHTTAHNVYETPNQYLCTQVYSSLCLEPSKQEQENKATLHAIPLPSQKCAQLRRRGQAIAQRGAHRGWVGGFEALVSRVARHVSMACSRWEARRHWRQDIGCLHHHFGGHTPRNIVGYHALGHAKEGWDHFDGAYARAGMAFT